MNSKQLIYDCYKKFYEQRHLLTEGPALSLNPEETNKNDFDSIKALAELKSMALYLLGINQWKTNEHIIASIKTAYADQEFWRNLLCDIVQCVLTKEKEEIRNEFKTIKEENKRILAQIMEEERIKKEIIKKFAERIKQENFAVDAEKLIRVYLNMSDQDEKKAYETLITNPAYFSPIITTDINDHTTLTPKEAIEENNRLAKFLKSLKI